MCICIAVLHHLSTTERRLEGLRELVRIVRPGGLVLVYVWALEQNLEKIKKKDLKELEFITKQNNKETKPTINDSRNNSQLSKATASSAKESKDSKEMEFTKKQSTNENENIANTDKHIGQDDYKEDKKEGGSHSVQVNIKREVFEQQDLFVPWKFRGGKQDKTSKDAENRTSGDIDEQTTSNVYHRFYHVFKEGELLELCSRLSNAVTRETYYDRGNWCVVLEKNDSN